MLKHRRALIFSLKYFGGFDKRSIFALAFEISHLYNAKNESYDILAHSSIG